MENKKGRIVEKESSQAPEGNEVENLVTNNANGNGINPSPVESGNNPEWSAAKEQTDEYIKDSGAED